MRRSIKEKESVNEGSRVGLDNASRVFDLHRGGDPSVDASARTSVPCLGSDPRGDAVKELPGRRTERSQCFQPDWIKVGLEIFKYTLNFGLQFLNIYNF